MNIKRDKLFNDIDDKIHDLSPLYILYIFPNISVVNYMFPENCSFCQAVLCLFSGCQPLCTPVNPPHSGEFLLKFDCAPKAT